MKRMNKKWTTLMLAGVCAASLCVATGSVVTASAATTAATYAITDVFATSGNATATSENNTLAFTLAKDETARIKRDLAFRWYEAGAEKFLSVQFAFKALNFDKVVFTVEGASSVAATKATNKVEFTQEGGKVYAAVINADTTDENKYKVEIPGVAAGTDITLSLTEGSKFDTFGVKVNDTVISEKAEGESTAYFEFTQVGANFGDYKLVSGKREESVYPLEIAATPTGEAKTVVLLKDINGQSFDTLNADKKIVDDAKPVLVVNQDVIGFQHGTVFTLNYEKIDVLKDKSLTETKEFYQWSPADAKAEYKTLTTSTYFMEKVYYVNAAGDVKATKTDGYTATTTLQKDGQEYVAIQFTLSDGSTGNNVVDLSWYATDADKNLTEKTVKKTVKENGQDVTKDVAVDFFAIKNYEEDVLNPTENPRPYYKSVSATEIANYQARVDEAAKDIVSGSDSTKNAVNLPDVEWLIGDDNGYRGLKFTISYKMPTTSSAKTSSSLSYSALKVKAEAEGYYEFKIFAVDAAGNSMQCMLDGKLVDVTASNVWEIEEIPSFTFTIADSDIKVVEITSKTEKRIEKTVDSTYTLSGLKIQGVSGAERTESYALYRVDASKCSKPDPLSKALSEITFEEIRAAALPSIKEGATDCFEVYHEVYAKLVAKKVFGDSATANQIKEVKNAIIAVEEYNADITEDDAEWEEYNKYNWKPTSKSFKAAEQGEYIIFADFCEEKDGLPTQRAVGFKVVDVKSEKDVIKGDSEIMTWVRNNLVSVILFGVAGLMLIAIIILLLVKPSDEKLEDVEETEAKKKEKKAKKSKKDEE